MRSTIDFDQRMEEIRASLQSIAKGRSSQKERGLDNQMEEVCAVRCLA